jgi:putative exosortase-associated protein (TIGR04073 family)
MRSFLKPVSLLVTVAAVLVGCTSAEQKLGRGLNNVSEPFRLGELQRSYEQGALFGGAHGGTVGIVRGVNRTIGRTVVGAVEVLSFPFPASRTSSLITRCTRIATSPEPSASPP